MAACGTHLTEGKFCLAHRLFFNNWIELPTTFTQTSVSWALLGKNGKVWQYWTAFLLSNVQQDLRSNVRRVMWSPVPSNIILSPRPSSLHFLLIAWPSGHLRMCLCWRFLYPLGSQKKTLQRRWLFNRTLKYGCAEILCSFTAQRETSTNFTCIFSYRPCLPFLSAGQHKVSAICILESRQLEFPFSLCHLPDEWIWKPGPVTQPFRLSFCKMEKTAESTLWYYYYEE